MSVSVSTAFNSSTAQQLNSITQQHYPPRRHRAVGGWSATLVTMDALDGDAYKVVSFSMYGTML
ncbi:MAG: FIG01964566: Predicted membrane protein, hemolysin III homolog [uncultured Paraburkholderia sp.]|nr:MAG: FIG01964566: Predicted membrane protein, hemolysin III homolog [uncultured Paraburkholderia sp.]CAH2941562.1 MAG: FIG01964566: Predicted membrane protein, hemolysin III homolog [uncultured Paraburkholderia sp.]